MVRYGQWPGVRTLTDTGQLGAGGSGHTQTQSQLSWRSGHVARVTHVRCVYKARVTDVDTCHRGPGSLASGHRQTQLSTKQRSRRYADLARVSVATWHVLLMCFRGRRSTCYFHLLSYSLPSLSSRGTWVYSPASYRFSSSDNQIYIHIH